MQLGAGKEDDPTRRDDQSDLRVKIDELSRFWKRTRILTEKLSDVIAPVFLVPLIVVVALRVVFHGLVPIARMKGHRVVRPNAIDGNPPVDLTGRRGIPCVPMRMPGIGDSCRQIISTRRATHLRDIKIGLLQITTHVTQERLEIGFGLWMVDEVRLELC